MIDKHKELIKKAEDSLKFLCKEEDTLEVTLTSKTVLDCCTHYISRVIINGVSVCRCDIHRSDLYDKTEEETVAELLDALVEEYKKQLEENEQAS